MPLKNSTDIDILIVDDQMGVRSLISEALEKGYRVDQAASGGEALQLLREKCYRLIILDVKMPGMSGLETLREIRNIDRGVPVMLMTAYEELDIMEEAGKLGVAHYLCKPFDINELRALAEKFVQPGSGKAGDTG